MYSYIKYLFGGSDIHNQLRLQQAVRNYDLNRVRKLLRSGCDVNYIMKNEEDKFCSYLHLANDSMITRELLLHGAHVDALNHRKRRHLNMQLLIGKDSQLLGNFLLLVLTYLQELELY